MAPVLPLNGRKRRSPLRRRGHPPMWTFARSDLKFRLTMRIVAVSACCFAATSAYVLLSTPTGPRAPGSGWIAEITAKDLELQRAKMHWVNDPSAVFPDLQTIAAPLMAPGLCIAYRAHGGDILQRFCGGSRSGDTDPPVVFAALYRGLFDPGREAVRPVLFHDEDVGEAMAWVDPATLTAQAWHEASRLLAVMAIPLLLLCGLVYAALARALRPTRLIRAGLERIAANDLSARLPPFDLAELSAIRGVFNHLAESLERTLAERGELTRRLIALQDDERRHLARELHDEFGQCLAAHPRSRRVRRPDGGAGLSRRCCPNATSIERIAAHMTETLRGALFRLAAAGCR